MIKTHRNPLVFLSGLLALILFAGTWAVSPVSHAAEFLVTPSFQAKGEYTSNIRLTATDPTDDWRTILSPGLDLSYNTERFSLKTDFQVDFLLYLQETQLNTEHYDLDAGAEFRPSERFRFNLGYAYVRDSTLDTELDETGVVTVRSMRDRTTMKGGATYTITERSSLTADIQAGNNQYDGHAHVNFDSYNASLTFQHQLPGRRDAISLRPFYSLNESAVSRVDTYGMYVGWYHAFSERFNINALVGARHTESAFTRIQTGLVFDASIFPPYRLTYTEVTQKEENWGGVADIKLVYTGDQYEAQFGFTRDLSYTSVGDPIERDMFRLDFAYRITERFRGGASANLVFSESDTDRRTTDTTHYSVRPFVHYRVTQDSYLRLEYSYAKYEDNSLKVDNTAERHKVSVTYRIAFPMQY